MRAKKLPHFGVQFGSLFCSFVGRWLAAADRVSAHNFYNLKKSKNAKKPTFSKGNWKSNGNFAVAFSVILTASVILPLGSYICLTASDIAHFVRSCGYLKINFSPSVTSCHLPRQMEAFTAGASPPPYKLNRAMRDVISARWNRFAMKSAYGRLCKNAIFRCIVRKSPDLPADAYLVYVRVENQGFDKTRR